MTNRRHLRLFSSLSILTFAVLAVTAGARAAGPADGRPTTQVPAGPNVPQAAASSEPGGNLYEPSRIERTVPLDPAGGLQGKWDLLYAVQDGSGGVRTTYLDWDETYLYVAVETVAPVEIRVDIDGANDGWLRGADNLSLNVIPPADGTTGAPNLIARRFDMLQNREAPVWAASPIAVADIKVATGKTPRGTYAITLAIPHTDVIGLSLKPGSSFGIRADAGAPTLPPTETEAVNIPVRPMLRATLSDSIAATNGGLSIHLGLTGPRDITPGGNVKTVLEVKNNGTEVKRLARLYIRGSLSSSDFVDESKFAGVDVAPGQTIKRELESSVAPAAPFGAVTMSGGGDLDDGTSVVSLLSFDKVQPYSTWIESDGKPIPAGGQAGHDPVRTVRVFVRSRVNTRTTAHVQLKLPEDWKTPGDSPVQRDLALVRDGDVEMAKFDFIVPAVAKLGPHKIGVSVTVNGKEYDAETTVVIAQ